ncbi:hypothetical protein M407DRAFT_19894 [Tulasnella calospora MUT 4182]|uniref:CS domain-containing protein n=1 Tax=Tulasnella calospora MUT 4182 TaxID=1051891 RepID=A0A0C3MB94_9AGAM|nr:hypothetical protein M407DRAFT_19894 [Tulasnella calospora MUT 4182]
MASELLKCSRPGCGKMYDPKTAGANSCVYHPGQPIFHEGLKSWNCCQDLPGHKPALDWEGFQAIPGCTTGQHMTKAPAPKPAPSPAASSSSSTPRNVGTTSDGKEVYSTGLSAKPSASEPSRTSTPVPPPKVEEDEDDPSVPVAEGSRCLRNGCKVTFINDEESRNGDGESAKCVYHPKAPIFHEGSKGYQCCKPKVLEFEEFLKIQGCKTGRHVFVKKAKSTDPVQELVKPRIDHYQTLDKVHVSVFAKKVDASSSEVKFEDEKVHLQLNLPDGKRCIQSLDLWAPIDPSTSTYKVLGTKVDIVLVKQQPKSWTLLEKTAAELPAGFGFTFSAGGRTGTTGAKDLVLDPNNLAK